MVLYSAMLSRVATVVVVRQASHSAFKLPPIKFRHSALPSSKNEDVPVITSPVIHGKEPGRERRRGKGEERAQRKQKSFKQPQPKQEKSLLACREDSNTSKNDAESLVNPKKNKYTTKPRTKFTTKSPSQSVEDTLASLGINVKGEIIFGIFPVLLAVQAKRRTIHQLIYKSESGNTSAKIQNILNMAQNQDVPTVSLKPSEFKQIFQGDQVHQGVCCDASPLPFLTLNEDYPEEEGEGGHGKQNEDGVKESRHQREGKKDSQLAEDPNQKGEDNRQGEEEAKSRLTERMKHQREEEQESQQKGEEDRYITQAVEKNKQSQQENHQAGIERRQQKLWLYLDQIQDPMNFGTVLRSAYFMGVDRVLTSEASSTRITSTVSKASAGVAEVFPVHQVKDPIQLAASLTRTGWELVSSASPSGASGSGDEDSSGADLTDVTAFYPKGNVLLIVGNEGKGISPELQRMCHTVLTISPGRSLHPHLQCLNVSVATALLLHSLYQKLSSRRP